MGEAVSSAAKSLMPTVLDAARKAGAFVGKVATVPLRKTAPTTVAPLAEERIGDEDAIQR
jgi:alkaline phosphatase